MAEPLQNPLVRTREANVQPVAGGADLTTVVAVAAFDANVTKVTYAPVSAITGANTNSRTVALNNFTQTLVPATIAYVSGVNAAAGAENVVTLGNAANVLIAAGDVLEWVSTHVGTGIADPGGLVRVQLTRR